jgi:citrate lyase subunit beta / citryl-CoA lyase
VTIVPDWQSLLFVPVGADRHLASAIRHRPDAIILDLEDAIAPDAKSRARQRLADAQAEVAVAAIACIVRVNAPLAAMVEDLAAADHSRLDAVLVPKCEGQRPLLNAFELVEQQCGLIALIETPAAVANLNAIAATSGVIAMMLGSEDFSAALGVDPNGGALDFLAAEIAVASASHGLLSIGFPGSIANFRNLELYGAQIERGRRLGMQAVAAIHPAQLPIIAARLTPSESELAWAERVLAAAGGIEGRAQAVFAGEEGMVDAPVIARARRMQRAATRSRAAGADDSPEPAGPQSPRLHRPG